jgi:hypothetical protein
MSGFTRSRRRNQERKIVRRRISQKGKPAHHKDHAEIIEAAVKYDHEGCDVCGHQPIGREIYPIGRRDRRVVGVCHDHRRSLDVILCIQIFMEGEENQKQREMTEAVSTDGPKH